MNNVSLAMGDWVLSGTLLGKPDGKEIGRPPSSLAPYLYLIHLLFSSSRLLGSRNAGNVFERRLRKRGRRIRISNPAEAL